MKGLLIPKALTRFLDCTSHLGPYPLGGKLGIHKTLKPEQSTPTCHNCMILPQEHTHIQAS